MWTLSKPFRRSVVALLAINVAVSFLLVEIELMSSNLEKLLDQALRAHGNDDAGQLVATLWKLEELISDFSHLEQALTSNGLREISRICFSNRDNLVRLSALSIVIGGLLNAKAYVDAAAVETLLQLLRAEILNVTARSDLFRLTFEALSEWCSFGPSHRNLFLRVFPLEELADNDAIQYPGQVLSSFVKLIRNVISQGPSEKPLLACALEIFGKALQSSECTCQLAKQVYDSISDAIDKFGREDSVNVITTSSFVDVAADHVLTRESCNRNCLGSILRLISRCLTSSNPQTTCQRLVDQRVLCLINTCLHENHSEAFEPTCTALDILFSRSLNSMHAALSGDLVQPLFALRGDPRPGIREGARRILQLFFYQGTHRQIVALLKEERLASMVELLRSEQENDVLDCLHWIFVLIAATRIHDELNLKTLRERMMERGVRVACVNLRSHTNATIRSLAGALYTFLVASFQTTADEEVSRSSWSCKGTSTENIK